MYKHLLAYDSGKDPGPEGSLDKLLWSESFQKIAELSLLTLGKNAALNENSKRG